jgi:hypothetical protein
MRQSVAAFFENQERSAIATLKMPYPVSGDLTTIANDRSSSSPKMEFNPHFEKQKSHRPAVFRVP